ncbi:MAG: acetyltransferase [Cyanobacteriota bacterium]
MFLKNKQTGDLIEILNVEELFNPNKKAVSGKDQAGQEEQETASFEKKELIFPSGESLPRCWMDENYTTT